ncbi:MAG TPA: cold shock domain-containing protein [Syntrophales bacterium]|jgi:cold shock CspA family protein|nr:cold shock domain-containing protein [Syntrophales bacterium]HPN25509.1 cold shock domain-containing protein [Syntrophales bacterium]HQM28455.1 cold shock domain-containing protein [Syntrophales bacterium]
MSKGTIRWFNQTIGAGFIRTDDGNNILFLKSTVRKSGSSLIQAGVRVCVDALESQDGLTATNVWAVENDRVK